VRTLAYRDEGGLGAVDEATERARAEELLRVGRGSEGEGEDAQHGEEHRRQKDEVTLRLAVPSSTSPVEESGQTYRWGRLPTYVVPQLLLPIVPEDAVGVGVLLREEHAPDDQAR